MISFKESRESVTCTMSYIHEVELCLLDISSFALNARCNQREYRRRLGSEDPGQGDISRIRRRLQPEVRSDLLDLDVKNVPGLADYIDKFDPKGVLQASYCSSHHDLERQCHKGRWTMASPSGEPEGLAHTEGRNGMWRTIREKGSTLLSKPIAIRTQSHTGRPGCHCSQV